MILQKESQQAKTNYRATNNSGSGKKITAEAKMP